MAGGAGSHILSLLRELRQPIVTTLHTILREPNAEQCDVMAELIRLSDRLVVMSQRGAQFLQDVHGVESTKIDLIPHGIPAMPVTSQEHFAEPLPLAGKSILLTFGLLSPDKGIENVIEAMPDILAQFPQVVYVILGATHPHVREQHGESYRQSLEALTERLGVRESVHFYNRFVPIEELTQFLDAADIYITPYLKPEQITSGTLAYAVGCGKAVISTPYYYAQELLAEERGILVPWNDPKAIAQEVIGLLREPERCKALQARAAEYGRAMAWPAVAQSYMQSFLRARVEKSWHPRVIVSEKVPVSLFTEVPPLNLSHLRLMTDDTGLLQHATYNVPNRDEGHCLDDNVRALLLMTQLEKHEEAEWDLGSLSARYLAFVNHAWNPQSGRFRNFLSYDRAWLEEQGSEDSHGRALWALGTVAGWSGNSGWRSLADRLFDSALPVVAEFTSPRAWAYTLLGIEASLHGSTRSSTTVRMRDLLAQRLLEQFVEQSTFDWPWLEQSLTYANARLPQALIVCGRRMQCEEMLQVGLSSLGWLASVQCSKAGWFSPIGSNGFYLRGETLAGFDQQPIEACGMISACRDAFQVTGDVQWLQEARRAFAWFLGENVLHQSLYDPLTGGCSDGLHEDRLNENQGAESTLSFLQASLEIRFAERKLGARTLPWQPQCPDLLRQDSHPTVTAA